MTSIGCRALIRSELQRSMAIPLTKLAQDLRHIHVCVDERLPPQ